MNVLYARRENFTTAAADVESNNKYAANTQGDSDVISVSAGFRRHLVGKTLRKVFHCDIAEIHFCC